MFPIMMDQLPEGDSYRKNDMLVQEAFRQQLEKGTTDSCYF